MTNHRFRGPVGSSPWGATFSITGGPDVGRDVMGLGLTGGDVPSDAVRVAESLLG